MGLFDGLPVPPGKEYLRDELSKVDACFVTPHFDSLPHVVHIMAARDREREVQFLREQSDVVEEVVDEIVQLYHNGFNKAIQNYSQILNLFSESGEMISDLKIDLAESKKRLSARNRQLHQLWYRSVTLRHIISLLDQIEGISKVPARIKKLISEKQFYAAVQSLGQSALMLEREGLQLVGALQEVRSELNKMRGSIFISILEELHDHLYNKGEFSIRAYTDDRDDEGQTARAVGLGGGSYRPGSVIGELSTDVLVEESSSEPSNEAATDGQMGGDGSQKEVKVAPRQVLTWLSCSTPDEFVETMKKSEAPLHVKYLRTLVECLSMLGKIASAGAMICQRLRPTIHEIITSKIKAHADFVNSSRSGHGQGAQSSITNTQSMKGQLENYQVSKQKRQNEITSAGTLMAVSPVSHVMAPKGKAQIIAKELLDSVLDTIVHVFENHVVVGELLASKSGQEVNLKGLSSLPKDVTDSELSVVTGGYSVGFSLTVLQSECQQLICEIIRATPKAAAADAAVQTARATAPPVKNSKDESGEELTFVFRFTDATMSKQGAGVLNKKGSEVLEEGYGSATLLPERGIYLAAAVYRPVLQFTQKLSSILPENYSSLGNDGLLAFVEKFVKEQLLATMFVEYRKGVQQAISSPSSFRPRAQTAATYIPWIEKGRPVLPGLLSVDMLIKEVLGWAQAMPKYADDLMNFIQCFLERTYEKCRTSYMEAVLQKQSYMLIARNDIERLMRMHPASSFLPNPHGLSTMDNNTSDAEVVDIELQMNDLLLRLLPIRRDNLIHDDNRLLMLASLSDSLEYVADSIERLGLTTLKASNDVEESVKRPSRIGSISSRAADSFADGYRRLAVDCLKVLRVEMQLETIFHLQEMTKREYLEDRDAEEPDEFIAALTAKIGRRDEAMAPFVAGVKRSYIFGGICGIAADTSVKALADMKSINLFGVQQICRNTLALEQVLICLPSINSELVQLRLGRVRTYYELLNMPFEALLVFITENPSLFTPIEYENLLSIQVPGREIPADAISRVSEILSQ